MCVCVIGALPNQRQNEFFVLLYIYLFFSAANIANDGSRDFVLRAFFIIMFLGIINTCVMDFLRFTVISMYL